jgi:perosamine synthetase
MYKERLKDIKDLQFNAEPDGGINGVWATGLVFGKSHNMSKADAIEKLKEIGIPSRPFFYPLSSLPAYPGQEKIYKEKNPNAYDISSRGINLACAFNLSEKQIDAITDGIRTILTK